MAAMYGLSAELLRNTAQQLHIMANDIEWLSFHLLYDDKFVPIAGFETISAAHDFCNGVKVLKQKSDELYTHLVGPSNTPTPIEDEEDECMNQNGEK